MNRKSSLILKLFAAFFALALVAVSLVACTPAGTPDESSNEPQNSPEESSPIETPAETPIETTAPETTAPETEPETEPQKDPITLNIGSYNIANGKNFVHIKKIGADIKDKNLDIVGVQEVDQKASRTGMMDSMKILSETSGLPYYAFFKAINLGGGEYGVGVLSRFPIVKQNRTELYSGDEEQRVLGHTVIDVDGTEINFFVTHLSFEAKTLRNSQFQTIAAKTADLDNFIVVGDFNTSDFLEYSPIKNADMVCNSIYAIKTFPSPTPTSSIDNIVFSKANWKFKRPAVLANGNSDHCMLYATGTFDPN